MTKEEEEEVRNWCKVGMKDILQYMKFGKNSKRI